MYIKSFNINLKKITSLLLGVAGILCTASTEARLVFPTLENATNADNYILDNDDSASEYIDLEFGSSLSSRFRYDKLSDNFNVNKNLDLSGNELTSFRVENVDSVAEGGRPTCTEALQGRVYYDSNDDNAYICIEVTSGFWGWYDFTTSISNFSARLMTVGTGGDFPNIAQAASYLNSLNGGIIFLTPETHTVDSTVDLEMINIIGSNTYESIINLTGAGLMQAQETQFKSLTIEIDSGITSAYGIDLKSNLTSSSIVFEWVNFNIGGTKILLDTSAASPPELRTRFVHTSATSNGGGIVNTKTSSNLLASSIFFVASQGVNTGGLEFHDWDVQVAGDANVLTTGTINTIPNDTIYVYPGMDIEGASNSLPNGGILTLLPGTHEISAPINITNNSIEIVGYGDASIIRASGFASTGSTIAAIHMGAEDGTAPVNDVVLKDFKIEVDGPNIHGVRAAGGEDLQIYNVTIQKISGQAGSGSSARMGIHFLDGTTEMLMRPVIKNCRIFGNEGTNYFTDGIHVTGGPDYSNAGIWTNGAGIKNALVDGNNIDYVRETTAVFVGVNDSSLYNNRLTRMGVGSNGAYGLFLGSSERTNMNTNVVSRSLTSDSYGFVIENFNNGSLRTVSDCLINNNTIDGTNGGGGVGFQFAFFIGNSSNTAVHRNIFQNNIIKGASNITTNAFDINGNFDDNVISNNSIYGGITDPWDVGVDIGSSAAERNAVRNNQFINVTTPITDGGTNTTFGTFYHNSNTDPTVNDDNTDGFYIGTIWINTSTEEAFISLDDSTGGANWDPISGGASGGITNVIEDTSPELGGNLDTNNYEIISGSGEDITLDPGTGGNVSLYANVDVAGNTFVLDSNDSGGDITLQFGATLGNYLRWSDVDSKFVLNAPLEVQGDVEVVGQASIANNHTATDSDGTINLGREGGTWETVGYDNVDNEVEVSTNTEVQGYLDVFGNNIIIDADNSGGDVAVQFGQAANKTLTWNDANSRFEFNDSVRINGNNAIEGITYIATDQEATASDGVLSLGRSAGAWETLIYNTATGQFELSDDLQILGALDVNNVDLNLNQLIATRVENLSAAPNCNAASTGRIYFNTSDQKTYICNGSAWVDLSASGGGSGSSTIVAQYYDSSGGLNINTTSSTAIPWNTETREDTGFTHTGSSALVYIDNPGWYEISYSIAYDTTASSRRNILCQIELNGSTLVPSRSYSYARNSTDDKGSNHASLILQTTTSNEYYEVTCQQEGTSGSNSTIPNESWTVIKSL